MLARSQIAPSKMIEITNKQFNNIFSILSQIDSGTYGVVQKGKNKIKGIEVAIKIIKDFSTRDTFENEQSLMETIDHPNVLNSLGLYYIRESSKIILVSPYCSNGSLKSCLEKIKLRDDNFKLKICLQMAQGLNALHLRNFMHRDIKPANILFDEDWMPKICDFGFTKLDNDFEKTIRVGTIAYRDPTIISGNYSKKCDIYSLGLVFFYVFKGGFPFEQVKNNAHFEREVIQFQQKSKERVQELKNCPKQMKQILKGCLEKRQIYRYDSQKLVQKLLEVYEKISGDNSFSVMIQAVEVHQYEQSAEDSIQKMVKRQNLSDLFLKGKKGKRFKTSYAEIFSSPEKQEQNYMQSSQVIVLNKGQSTSSFKLEQIGGMSRIFKARTLVDEELEKTVNAEKVYNYFIKRKVALKKLDQVLECGKINICPALWISSFFEKQCTIFLIKGGRCHNSRNQSQEMSQRMITECTNLISNETKKTKLAIKRFLTDLYSDQHLYGQSMSPVVKKMINNGIEREFSKIELLSGEEIRNQFMSLIKRNQKNSDEKTLAALNEIKIIFS